jgi:hypothetical protein
MLFIALSIHTFPGRWLRWKPLFALPQDYTRSYLAPPGVTWITQCDPFTVREPLFAPLECSECDMEATGWLERSLDLRVCRRQGKPWTSGSRLLREKKAKSGAGRSQDIPW